MIRVLRQATAAADRAVHSHALQELPSAEELKEERAAKIRRLGDVELPEPPKFPIDAMCDDVEAVRARHSNDSAPPAAIAHQAVLAFARQRPLLLARLKLKLCARWALLALRSGESDARPSRAELAELAPAMADCVRNINHGTTRALRPAVIVRNLV